MHRERDRAAVRHRADLIGDRLLQRVDHDRPRHRFDRKRRAQHHRLLFGECSPELVRLRWRHAGDLASTGWRPVRRTSRRPGIRAPAVRPGRPTISSNRAGSGSPSTAHFSSVRRPSRNTYCPRRLAASTSMPRFEQLLFEDLSGGVGDDQQGRVTLIQRHGHRATEFVHQRRDRFVELQRDRTGRCVRSVLVHRNLT